MDVKVEQVPPFGNWAFILFLILILLILGIGFWGICGGIN